VLQTKETVVNGGLLDAFRHNAWATRQLLEFCRNVSAEQLNTPGTGTYAGILETFNHLVMTESRYLRRLAGSGPAWVDSAGGSDPGDVDLKSIDIERLRSSVDELGERWEALLSEPFDSERLIILDEGAYQARAGVLVAQALFHGNTHREQISAMLTAAGKQPPDIQGWSYGEATGRGGERKTDA
jgi:uncharacterized damage-inducible protein DinB